MIVVASVFQVPILIPCHRVICSDGTMGNYTGGRAVKEWLLAHEGNRAEKLTCKDLGLAGTTPRAASGTTSSQLSG